MKFRAPQFSRSGFTMVEIAISLAIIGIALVAIIGVLPLGMNVQRDNRENTVINQDATVFIEAIRSGSLGLDDLTNYVYAITNYWTEYNDAGGVMNQNHNGYDDNGSSITWSLSSGNFAITNGMRIVGLLGMPEFMDLNGAPTDNLFNAGYSNHITAYVRSISGPAVEKPPQDNDLVRNDAFSYALYCVNAPVATDTNQPALTSPYSRQMAENLHELRLTFLWPIQPNGSLGGGRQTYRALIAGQIMQTYSFGQPLYFYQSQSFTNAP